MLRKLLILAALLAWPGLARAEWQEASTAHFTVYSNDRPERLRAFATDLERFDKALRVTYARPDVQLGAANRVTVFVVDSEADVRRLSGGRNTSGFYLARASGTFAFVPRVTDGSGKWSLSALEVLLHEYGHHFLFTEWPDAAYPRWFSEGLAEFYATASFEEDGGVTLGRPPLYRAHDVMLTDPISVEKLLTFNPDRLGPDEISAIYGRGWLLTHYLALGGGRSGQLNGYLREINSGKSALEAAKIFGDLTVLDRELQRYRRTKRFTVMRIAPRALTIPEVALRRLDPAEVATIEVRQRSKRGVDEKTAPAVYEAARRACAPYPNHPAAQLVLAEAAFDAKDYPAAKAAAERAVAADAKSVGGWLYKAMAEIELAKQAKDWRPATWSAIRRSISTANRLDPDDPQPLILYYRSFVEAGQPPTADARKGLYYAFLLAPYDEGLRMSTAQVYLDEGDKASARRLLAVLAYDPHNAELAGAAAKLIDQIDKPASDRKPAEAKAPAPSK